MKIRFTELQSDDIDATAKFYGELLQSSAVTKGNQSIAFKAGYSELRFLEVPGERPVYHFAFNIPCNKLSEALDFVERKAEIIPVSGKNRIADFSAWNAEAFYFFDNNGNILEFIARHDLDNAIRSPFDGSQVVSLSEVALVTENVQQLARDIRQKTGIPVYEKQPLLDNFGALGNAEGLFILSKTARHWYPTEIPAEKFYCKVKCEEADRVHELTF